LLLDARKRLRADEDEMMRLFAVEFAELRLETVKLSDDSEVDPAAVVCCYGR